MKSRRKMGVGFAALMTVMGVIVTGCTASPEAVQPSTVPAGNPMLAEPPLELQEISGLDRIPWEGGPSYWKQFERAREAGWTDEEFFPIVSWFNGISSQDEVEFDKSLGLNTYIGMSEETPYSLFAENNVYFIGSKLNETFNDESVNWVGQLLGDEIDGQFVDPAEGLAHLEQQAAQVPPEFFRYTNFTQLVIGKDMDQVAAQRYVNGPLDVVSLDMYWYTVPFCSTRPYRDIYLVPVSKGNCRTASSYGKSAKALWMRDGEDGVRKPIWQFVENYNGGPGGQPLVAVIEPREIEAAVMNSLINEARGILYFNQSLSGDCQSGNVFRAVQMDPNFCAAKNVRAVSNINNKILDLASVLNTQSYVYEFGSGIQTMLKSKGGYAYIFAMIDGASDPGKRSFKLPEGIGGRVVEVVYENRTLDVDEEGHFTDRFDDETTYHIYKVGI